MNFRWYEDFHILVPSCWVILNSRPLYPLTDDLQGLIPEHFLIQRCLRISLIGKGLKDDLSFAKRWLQVQEL